MLSILIPTYNYDITKLVKDLHRQATVLDINFEILVMEDGSDKYITKNQGITLLANCQHIELDQNIGSSAIRNKLAATAKYPYLLFIDCDAAIHHKDFLQRYISCCFGEVVLIGGSAYDPMLNDSKYSLQLKYSRERESNLNCLIHHHGNESFNAFNFLISKSIFDKIKFDEAIICYRLENTFLGYYLHEAGYAFQRIDNQVVRRKIVDNKIFLENTNENIENLYQLFMTGNYPCLENELKLLRSFLFINKYHLTRLIAFIFHFSSFLLVRNLIGKHPSLKILDAYKLMLLCKYHVSADKLTD